VSQARPQGTGIGLWGSVLLLGAVGIDIDLVSHSLLAIVEGMYRAHRSSAAGKDGGRRHYG
jgi:hypothetical protein